MSQQCVVERVVRWWLVALSEMTEKCPLLSKWWLRYASPHVHIMLTSSLCDNHRNPMLDGTLVLELVNLLCASFVWVQSTYCPTHPTPSYSPPTHPPNTMLCPTHPPDTMLCPSHPPDTMLWPTGLLQTSLFGTKAPAVDTLVSPAGWHRC